MVVFFTFVESKTVKLFNRKKYFLLYTSSTGKVFVPLHPLNTVPKRGQAWTLSLYFKVLCNHFGLGNYSVLKLVVEFCFAFIDASINMAGVEELYKQFGILADANEKAGEVS